MKLRTRRSALLLSAAAFAGLAAVGTAEGSLSSALVSRLAGLSKAPRAGGSAASDIDAPADTAPTRLVADARYRDGNFTGPAINTYYGPVQVRANIRDGHLSSVDVPVYPADRRASQRINNSALPLLEREVISAQSARVNIISGATLTSEAYLRSLDGALRNAGGAQSVPGTEI